MGAPHGGGPSAYPGLAGVIVGEDGDGGGARVPEGLSLVETLHLPGRAVGVEMVRLSPQSLFLPLVDISPSPGLDAWCVGLSAAVSDHRT